MKGKLHDQMGNILFDNKYAPEEIISIKKFQDILVKKLKMGI